MFGCWTYIVDTEVVAHFCSISNNCIDQEQQSEQHVYVAIACIIAVFLMLRSMHTCRYGAYSALVDSGLQPRIHTAQCALLRIQVHGSGSKVSLLPK